MMITSGYRRPAQNEKLNATMTHTSGQAVDVSVAVGWVQKLIKIALEESLTGIDVKQKG